MFQQNVFGKNIRSLGKSNFICCQSLSILFPIKKPIKWIINVFFHDFTIIKDNLCARVWNTLLLLVFFIPFVVITPFFWSRADSPSRHFLKPCIHRNFVVFKKKTIIYIKGLNTYISATINFQFPYFQVLIWSPIFLSYKSWSTTYEF